MTLIFEKWIGKNKLLDVDRKKIVIPTNISYERVNFFVEKLHSLINFDHINTLNINEIDKLKTSDFDIIITFSNRMSNILNRDGYSPVQVDFFMGNNDLLKLFEAGCTIASNRLEAGKTIELISGMDKKKAKEYLKDNFPEVFL